MNMHSPTPAVDQNDLETAIDRAKCAVALVRLALSDWEPDDADTTDTLYVAVDFAEREAEAAQAAFYKFLEGGAA